MMNQNDVQDIQVSEEQMCCDAKIIVQNRNKEQIVSAIQYQLANTILIERQEYQIESVNNLQTYRLITDALEKYASKPERKVNLEKHNVYQIDEKPQLFSYFQTFQDEITLPFNNGELQKQTIEIKNKVLVDLIEQLEDIHSDGILVGYFNFNGLGYNKKLNKYMLLAFANLTLADDAILQGSIDILRKSVRSSLVFQSMNKQIDYLSLLKNFLIAVSDQQDEILSDKQVFQLIKDETFYFSDTSFGIAYSNQPCECRGNSPLKLCAHKTLKYLFSPSNQEILEKLKNKCLKLLEKENKLLEQTKQRNDFKKKTENITNQVAQIIEQIYQSSTEDTSVARLLELRGQVSQLLCQLPEYEKSEQQDKQKETYLQFKDIFDSIDEFVQLFKEAQ